MKKITFLLSLVVFAMIGNAQVDLSAVYGYQFGARTWISGGELRLRSNDNLSFLMDINLSPDVAVTLSYMSSASSITFRRNYWSAIETTNTSVRYYQMGITRVFSFNERLEWLGMFTLGATEFNLEDIRYNDEWRFSISMGLGAKIWLTDVVGIRLQARLLAPVNWAGLGFFCGTGGCGTSVNVGSTFISGDVGAGLVLRLGNR